jgi:hypothetical protein
MERGRGAHSNIALNMNGCSRIMKRLDDGYLTTPTSFLERCEAKLPQRRRGEGAEGGDGARRVPNRIDFFQRDIALQQSVKAATVPRV